MEQHTIDAIHCNFAAQLESLDLWYWAIFVALHITDVERRKSLAMDLLYRHISLDSSETTNNCEDFLRNKL
ncbi:hypothetical protein, partial [Staphylococcus aureus]|uniref:hypothetical protein n=1 Tax=Staphylococcus aureus TaxID=1280 RepID=UPI0038B23038